jgi:hypothetical protein
MFTFGREHGKKCSESRTVPLLLAVVDAVHDLIEGKGTEEALKRSLRKAFIEGGSGTDATWISISSASSSWNGDANALYTNAETRQTLTIWDLLRSFSIERTDLELSAAA